MKGLIEMVDKSKRGKAGFTLIELMIVIIIVGVLAAAAVPIYTGFVKRAYTTEAKATVGTIRSAQQVYFAEHSTWAVNSVDTTVSPDDLTLLGVDISGNRWFNKDTDLKWLVGGATGSGDDGEGVELVGTDVPVIGVGARIVFKTGVLEHTTDGIAWGE